MLPQATPNKPLKNNWVPSALRVRETLVAFAKFAGQLAIAFVKAFPCSKRLSPPSPFKPPLL